MAKGAIRPCVQILEDHLNRPVPHQEDPTFELINRGDIVQETEGVFIMGPLMDRLITYFESKFIALADSFSANPYHFPTLIPARFLEKVNYFHAFPNSLSFATHLREDLDIIDQFSQHAACDEEGLKRCPILLPPSRICSRLPSVITFIFHWQINHCQMGKSSQPRWATASDTKLSI